MMVDTHTHLYHPDESKYPMRENPSRPPEGTGTVEHLWRHMKEADVERAVLVQTGSAYRWDNRLVADVARANREYMVGVCNLDAVAEESVAELERLVTGFNVRGLRLEPAQYGTHEYDHAGSVRLFEAARRLGIVVCAHIGVDHLDALGRLLERFPDVPVVLDHSAYLNHADAPDSERVVRVCAMSRFPNLHTKLTFGVTGSEQAYPFRDTHALIRRVMEAFGPDRCMWGSDFPCEHWLRKATYVEHLTMFTEAMGLSAGEKTAILSETPMRVWFGG
jgi:L-fuconolactonase